MLEEEDEDGDDVGWSSQLEGLDPCSIWGFPEAASSLLGLTDEMARKVFCHFHFHFLHIIASGRDADLIHGGACNEFLKVHISVD